MSNNIHYDLRSNDDNVPKHIHTVTIHPTVTFLPQDIFLDCTELISVSIPDSVRRIGDYAFEGCTRLKWVHIPNSMISIGGYAFERCTQLVSVTLSDSTRDIGNDAFIECHALEKRLTNGYNYDADTETWLRSRFKNLPLHQAFFNITDADTKTMAMATLTDYIQQHESLLTSIDAMGMTPLHVLCGNPYATTEMIQMVRAAQPKTVSMTSVLGQTPLAMFLSMKQNNYSHVDGQLLPSLVWFLEMGLECDALEDMLAIGTTIKKHFYSEAEETDESSGLLPFMYAASLGGCSLEVVYKLANMIRGDLVTPA